MAVKMTCAKGERLNIRFNRKIILEFHGARLTSDGKNFRIITSKQKVFIMLMFGTVRDKRDRNILDLICALLQEAKHTFHNYFKKRMPCFGKKHYSKALCGNFSGVTNYKLG